MASGCACCAETEASEESRLRRRDGREESCGESSWKKCCGDGGPRRASGAGRRLRWRRPWSGSRRSRSARQRERIWMNSGAARFTTISGKAGARLYTQADLPEDWSEEKYLGYPGEAALHARDSCHGIPRKAVDDAAVLGICLAGGDQRALPVSAGAWGRWTVGGLRPANTDGL